MTTGGAETAWPFLTAIRSRRISSEVAYRSFRSKAHAFRMTRCKGSEIWVGSGSGSPLSRRSRAVWELSVSAKGMRRLLASQYSTRPRL